MINPSGDPLLNTDPPLSPQWRSAISGTFTFNTDTGAGTGTLVGFSFFGSGLAIATAISVQAIGDGSGGPGSLVLANMGFNWNNNNGIPVSLVMDAAGFFGCLGGAADCTAATESASAGTFTGVTTTIAGVGALAATEGTVFGVSGSGGNLFTIPLGAAPMVTTDWKTTTIGGTACLLGCNPSGTLPLFADTSTDTAVAPIVTGTVSAKSGTTTATKSVTAEVGASTDLGIGGSPMPAGPFAGFNANFDVTSMHIDAMKLTAAADGPLTVGVSSTTTHDVQDNDGNTLSPSTDIVLDDDGTSGTCTVVTVSGEKQIQYVAGASIAADTCTYHLTHAGRTDSGPATVTFSVGNAPPVAVDDDAGEIGAATEDTPKTIPIATLLVNDSDPDQALTVSDFESFSEVTALGAVQTGALVRSGDNLVYTPPTNFNGTATFTYTIEDDIGVSGTATVTITVGAVNDAPVAQDRTATVKQDTAKTIDVLDTVPPVSDVDDPSGASLTITAVTAPAHGSADISSDGRSVVYTPDAGYLGPDSFTYTVTDAGGATDTGVVDIAVAAGGDVFKVIGGTFTMPTVSPFDRVDSFGPGSLGFIQNGLSVGFSGASPLTDEDPITADFAFFSFSVDTYFNTEGVDTQPGTPGEGKTHNPPFIDLDDPAKTDLGAWYAYWNNTEFNQGTVDAINTDPNTTPVTITENTDGTHTLSWSSRIVGKPFDGKIGKWTLTVCKVDADQDGDLDIDGDDAALFSCVGLVGPAPRLDATQDGLPTRTILPGGGPVTVTTDLTTTDGLTFVWTATGLPGGTGTSFTFDPSTLPSGPITINVKITDPSTDPPTVSAGTLLLTVDATPGLTPADVSDADGDGVKDSVGTDGEDELVVDAADPDRVMTSLAFDLATAAPIASGGTRLVLGDAAFCAGGGAGISADDVAILGGTGCVPGPDADDIADVTHGTTAGELFDFKIEGVPTGGLGCVVLPLSEPIPERARYRIYAPLARSNLSFTAADGHSTGDGHLPGNLGISTGWRSFVESVDYSIGGDSTAARDTSPLFDSLRSADQTAPGVCPTDPAAYADGLQAGKDCALVCIVDGGPNDNDGVANGVVVDPAGIGADPPPAEANTSNEGPTSGGCSLNEAPVEVARRADWMVLGGFTAWLALLWRRRRSGI